jgi:ABC-type polysaccharide transport system permease subunit
MRHLKVGRAALRQRQLVVFQPFLFCGELIPKWVGSRQQVIRLLIKLLASEVLRDAIVIKVLVLLLGPLVRVVVLNVVLHIMIEHFLKLKILLVFLPEVLKVVQVLQVLHKF